MGNAECLDLRNELNSRWFLNEESNRLFCFISIPDSTEVSLHLFREIGELSERENHHPELCWYPGRLDIHVWTHKINALVESDFILAAKIDTVLAETGTSISSFNRPFREERLPPSSEMYCDWNIIPPKGDFFRHFSFGDFRQPLECALQLIELVKGLEIKLGYGHLGVRLAGEHRRDMAEKINGLILTGHL